MTNTDVAGNDEVPPLTAQQRAEVVALLSSVFVVAACGLVYELLIATVSSYLQGSSVTQFSLCIGTFIGAMGLGSYLSQWVGTRALLRIFVGVEVALSLLGGFSAWMLFGSYAVLGDGYQFILYGLLTLIGALVGIELPILTRLLNRYGALRTTIANALSFDYVGSLLGSLAFPLLLLPLFGATRTAFVVGLVNLAVSAYTVRAFQSSSATTTKQQTFALPLVSVGVTGIALVLGLIFADRGTALFERRLYEDEIIYAKQTKYQRIVMTRFKGDLRLFLDGNIQFAAQDEYRYHEPLVHPAMALSASRENVLILGGGDGLGVREVLKHADVRRVTLVDIDPAMTHLGKTFPALVRLNNDALNDDNRRVRIVHTDAYKFLESGGDGERFGVIIADLPDANNETLAKLYSREFFRLVKTRLGRGGIFVTQSSSPLVTRESFWCIETTLRSAGFASAPYHVYVPAFGDWGFHIARAGKTAPRLLDVDLTTVRPSLRYLSSASFTALTAFDGDTDRLPNIEVSTLDFPRILTYYQKGVKKWE